jgi:hypothetical protein
MTLSTALLIGGEERPADASFPGLGRELGRQGMHDFTETHVMSVPS